jgi:hypothetical protein
MPRIEGYRPGHVVVDGVEHTRDVIVLPDRVVGEWWRRDGHSLVVDDLDEVLDELPERLIVGCGYAGQLRPSDAVTEELRRRGTEVEALRTEDAVARYQELAAENPAAVAAALHLTC